MKKYFTKWLPSEDKLNINNLVEGDRVYGLMIRDDYDIDFIFSTKASRTSVYGNNGFEYFPKKIMKLFICSREFSVGDKITYIDGNTHTITQQGFVEATDLAYKRNKFGGEGHYKIVGRVSPEAVWVKQADEFDESELLQHGTGVNISPNEGSTIKIKCPSCKTFH